MGDKLAQAAIAPVTLLGSALFPKPPKPIAPAPMPDPADQLAARKRAAMQAAGRSGFESTILTNKLGPGA